MTASLTQILFNWNSEAVLKMQENNPGEAIAILQKCLQAQTDPTELLAAQKEAAKLAAMEAEEEAQEYDEDEPEEYRDKWDEIVEEMRLEAEANDDDEDDCNECRVDPYSDLFLISVPVNATTPLPSEGLFRIFDQAFITASLLCDDKPSRDSPAFIRAFLLYNMGLCVHQQAKSQPEALPLALNIYMTALRTLHNFFHQGHEADVIMLLLALNNNIAHIHAEHTKDSEVVQRCIDNIRSLIQSSAQVDFRRHGSAILAFFCVGISVVSDAASIAAGAA